MWFFKQKQYNERLIIRLYAQLKNRKDVRRLLCTPYEELYIDEDTDEKNSDIYLVVKIIEDKRSCLREHERLVIALYSEKFTPTTAKRGNK
jgi:hypothetical protein